MIKPLFNYVLVEPIKEEGKTTEAGIILDHVESVTKKGKVLMVGEKIECMKEGDEVLYFANSGINVKHDDKECLMLMCTENNTEILAVV